MTQRYFAALLVRYVHLQLAEDGCMYVRTKKWAIALAIYTGFSIAYEIVLLGFFIYPMKRAHAQRASEAKYAVLPIIKRSLLSAIACFLNGILFTFIHNFIERPLMLDTISTDLKHMVYYVSLVASYNDWLRKVCLPCAINVYRKTECKVTTSSRDDGKDGTNGTSETSI